MLFPWESWLYKGWRRHQRMLDLIRWPEPGRRTHHIQPYRKQLRAPGWKGREQRWVYHEANEIKLQGPSICWKSLKKCSYVMNFGKFNTNKIFNLNYYRLPLSYSPAFSGVGVATGMFKIQWSRSWVRYIEFNEIYFCVSQSFMCVIRLLTAGRGL